MGSFHNVYAITLLNLIFLYDLKLNDSNIKHIFKKGDSISATIVYAIIKEEEKNYFNLIEERIIKSFDNEALASDDFIFLTEFYLRNRCYINKGDKISFSNIKSKSKEINMVNDIYKNFIKNTKDVYFIDIKKKKINI